MNPYTERDDAMANGEPTANDYQVSGNHYRKVVGEQHWDRLVRLFGLERARCYFIGNITSYVERYQYKDGIKDLHKARHYITKLIELEEAEQNKHQLAKATQPLPEVKGPLDYLHYRISDTSGAMCGEKNILTTSRFQDVTCPNCLSTVDPKEYD